MGMKQFSVLTILKSCVRICFSRESRIKRKKDAHKMNKSHFIWFNIYKCWCGWTRALTCRVLTTSCILARPRSRKLSIRSPSMNPVACSVLRSVWKDLQVQCSQGKSTQGGCLAWGLHFRHNITYFYLRHTLEISSMMWSLMKTALLRGSDSSYSQ